ncbi:MAG: glycosyltransferase family 4 protein, partial [candidate division Zixibacteria bacterium]|nr:glycosyltransferase family 4 protein [candidate division Zixibacteria bacterium]
MFLLNDYLSDGRVRRTCRYLASKGYLITVIAESQSDDDELDIDGVKVIRLKSKGLFSSKGRFVKYMIRAAILGSKIPADIYHAFDLDGLLPAFITSVLNRGRLLYESHEYYTGLEALNGRPFTTALWKILERCLIYKTDHVITINDSIAEKLSARYAIAKPDIVYSCSDMAVDGIKVDWIREKVNIPDDKKIILYLGVLRRGQGLEKLLDIMKDIDAAVLVIIGGGPIESELKEKSEMLKLGKKVYFYGRVDVDDIAGYYKSSDLGILLLEPLAENNRLALPNKFFSY